MGMAARPAPLRRYRTGPTAAAGASAHLLGHRAVTRPDRERAPPPAPRPEPPAFHAGSPGQVDALTAEAPAHGWTLPFPETHPHAGGPDHYAAYLSNTDAFEVELVTTGGDQLVLP